MPLPDLPGLIYVPQTAEELRDQFLRDVRLQYIALGVANPPVQPGSEWYIRATAYANAMLGLYANQEIAANDTTELLAQGDALDAIREAMGLPEVGAAPASGKLIVSIITGSVLISEGTEFVLPNGTIGRVSASKLCSDGDTIDVITNDTGENANAAAGTIARWKAPPINVEATAEVDVDGLTGGVDAESDARKRERILNRRRYVPGGGNWGMARELALNSTGTVQSAFVYPALGGPSSLKVVVTKAMQLTGTKDFSREIGASTLDVVSNAVLAEYPIGAEVVVQSATDEDVSVGLQVKARDENWIDQSTVFPAIEAGDNGRVTVSAVTDSQNITVSAVQSTSPVAGQRILWWSPENREFVKAGIVSVSGSAGAWVLQLDTPLTSGTNTVATGDFISPAAKNANAYAATWLAQMNLLGPGENSSDGNIVPRSNRHPYINDEWHSDLSSKQITELQSTHPELSDVAFAYRSKSTPTVPANRADAPNVLRLLHFGIYRG